MEFASEVSAISSELVGIVAEIGNSQSAYYKSIIVRLRQINNRNRALVPQVTKSNRLQCKLSKFGNDIRVVRVLRENVWIPPEII